MESINRFLEAFSKASDAILTARFFAVYIIFHLIWGKDWFYYVFIGCSFVLFVIEMVKAYNEEESEQTVVEVKGTITGNQIRAFITRDAGDIPEPETDIR